ncbi:MAG: glycine cleavage system protein H [Thermoanaerobaculia bacterium]
MNGHELLSPHATKAIEYGIAIAYLVLFIPFWRLMSAQAKAPARAFSFADLFRVPEGIHIHRGHAWARPEGAGVMVGLDDFGHALVGAISGYDIPAVGRRIRQGDVAFGLKAGGQSFALRAPVDGIVTAVNPLAASDPAALDRDPYGAGWLFQVQPERLGRSLKTLFSGEKARKFLSESAEALQLAFRPEALSLAQDGGALVHGIARELDPEHWDILVRSSFLTR